MECGGGGGGGGWGDPNKKFITLSVVSRNLRLV